MKVCLLDLHFFWKDEGLKKHLETRGYSQSKYIIMNVPILISKIILILEAIRMYRNLHRLINLFLCFSVELLEK